MPYMGDLYFEEQGTGPALLLLHGHTLDRRMWEEHLPALSSRYRVITPDLPGHGKSGGPPDGEPWCDALANLFSHLDVERAAVCGLSMGGAVAVSFALNHPARCAALIPVDSALYGHPLNSWTGPKPYVKQARSEGLRPALEAWLADPVFAPIRALPAAERLKAMIREYPGNDWLTIPAYPPYPPGPAPESERLGQIKAPTLVLVGEHDLEDFQTIADRLAGSIPGARKRVIRGAGHLVPFEQPDLFRETLLTFLHETLGA